MRVTLSAPRLLALAIATVAAPACVLDEINTDPDPNGPGGGACVPTEDYFADEVWNAFMSSDCFACHNASGLARNTQLVLQGAGQTGYMDANLATVSRVASLEQAGTSYILLKPSMQIDHDGGRRFEVGSAEYQALEGLVERVNNPVECEVQDPGNPFEGVVPASNEDTFRKAALNLAGRLPTEDELAMVRDGDEDDLVAALDNLMMEDAFYERSKEMWNDLFLTNRYLGGNNATNLLDSNDFPNRRFYDDLEDTGLYSPEYVEMADDYVNDSVAREPLELIEHIMRNGLPFSDVLTADYFMVNGWSAQVYEVEPERPFNNPADPNEYRPARLDGVPHAGLLSSPMFLNRFPTTDTNRNRHRSRMIWRFFLATDILALADRPVDSGDIVDVPNPTRDNPNCSVCHNNIDPIAGAFQNWDERGRYRPPETGWHPEMVPPGIGEVQMPAGEYPNALQWLGRQISDDPRFALATVHNVFHGVTGQEPLKPPADPEAEDFEALTEAYEAQVGVFDAIAERFVERNFDIKSVYRDIVLSPYFRAVDATVERSALDGIGMARFLTPEMLDRKIKAALGMSWARSWDRSPYLRDENEYLIFYGGIDSDGVTRRITSPNGLMSAVARRMANEMACYAVAPQFLIDADDRNLFPHVEMSFTPEDENGFPVDAAVTAIKDNISYLHTRLLGERLDPADPELERTYNLWVDTWREGSAKVANDELSRDLPWQCRGRYDPVTGDELPWEDQIGRDEDYTVRAWMAVISYLLLDYRFLHE